ncbi:hypothetical protein BDW74DRAFT_181421 [Aspergillus multicolor]|uniref:uncharacterized protein n=1 Tax=Aspergillus multicolor TaxID=41759 RepID=UPI003CCD2010
MSSQQQAAGLPYRPPQGTPRIPRPGTQQHKLPTSIQQRTFPRLQQVSNRRLEQAVEPTASNNGLGCLRCGAPRGHRPACPQFSVATERKERKELERKKAIEQNQYEASRGAGLNVPVSAADAPYGLAIYPPGSAPPPPSAWPTAVIDLTDDTPAIISLSLPGPLPGLSALHQNTSATGGGLSLGERPASATTSSSKENQDPLFPPRRSEADVSSAPYSPPAAIPADSPTSYQPQSATTARTPSALFGRNDNLSFASPSRHRSPFDLSSGVLSPNDSFASFTAPVGPTRYPGTEPRSKPRRFSQIPAQRLSLVDRHPALAAFTPQVFPGQHIPVTASPRAETTASERIRMPISSSDPRLNVNGKRPFGESFETDSLFVSPSPPTIRPSAAAPIAHSEFVEPPRTAFGANADSHRPSLSQPTDTGKRVCGPSGTFDKRVPIPPPVTNTAPPAPSWPFATAASTSASGPGIPAFAGTAFPTAVHPAPPVLPRPVPGYVWIGSGWHGPVWTCALPAHMGGTPDPGDTRASDEDDQTASL